MKEREKLLAKIGEIWRFSNFKTAKRDLRKAAKLLERIPEDSDEFFQAQEYLSSLRKLVLAIEEGWIREETELKPKKRFLKKESRRR